MSVAEQISKPAQFHQRNQRFRNTWFKPAQKNLHLWTKATGGSGGAANAWITFSGGTVVSGAVSVIDKSGSIRKRFPRCGEMVRVVDRAGLFLVTRINREERAADLMQKVGKADVVDSNVPFDLIRIVPRDASRAIQAFLSAGATGMSITQTTTSTEAMRAPTEINLRSEGVLAALAARREPLAS